jgi:putative transcriptional regulator
MKKARKKKADLGDELIQSMQEALNHARGRTAGMREHRFDAAIRVKRIREKVGMTQATFAAALGVSISGLRKWEQGQRQPHGAARTLLNVMDRAPKAVIKALEAHE